MRRSITLPTLALLIGLTMVAAIGALVYDHLSSLDDTQRWVSHTHEVLESADAVTIAIRDASSAHRAYSLTGDDAALEPYRSAVTRVGTSRAKLRQLTSDNPGQQRRLDQLEPVMSARLAQLEDAIQERRLIGFDAEREATWTDTGNALTSRLRELLRDLQDAERELLDERQDAFRDKSRMVKRIMLLGLLASAVLLCFASLMLRREAMRRTRSEAALADRERRLAITLDSIGDGVIATDATGVITHVNPVAEQMTGWPAAEAAGRPFADVVRIIDETTRAPAPDPVARVLAERAKLGLANDSVLIARDGVERPIANNAAPMLDERGQLQGVVIVVRDVSRHRELERFRDEYVGYISHDLKNPLSIILLQAHLLSRQLDARASEAEQRSLRTIAENASFIDRLVRELLEMAYVESPQIEIHPGPVALAPFLQSVVERTVSTADRARIRVEILQPSTAAIEERRIERVVVNFLQNALKYAPPGTPILVRLEAKDDRAAVSVTDEGPGIAPEDQVFVFDKYRRAASARTMEGLGLGLYISRKIIEAHGGDIGVESAPGRGATFFFRLPRMADVPPPEPSIAGSDPAVPAKNTRPAGVKVLLVDDEVNAVSALTELLAEEGLDVTSATSGERALVLAHANRPDVVVLDVQMPGMSGLVLLERLRERYPGLPAVIMTGHMAHHGGIAEARESGAAYVAKPVDVEALLRTIDRVLPVRPAS